MSEDALLRIVVRVHSEGAVETTFAELLDVLADGEGPLVAVGTVNASLEKWNVKLRPGIEVGDLSTPRLLTRVLTHERVRELVEKEVKEGEHSELEFKESLLYDHARKKADPKCRPADLRSERVLESALRTVCAFLNSDGGTLLIGVADDHTIAGIDPDLSFFPGQTAAEQIDQYLRFLRSKIDGHFHEGHSVNHFLQAELVALSEGSVVRVRVERRKGISCVKIEGAYSVFARQGNRTARLEVYEIADFVLRRQAGLTA